MAKRAHGEGSLYQRSNGSWQAQVTVSGRRVSHTARTKKDAQAWLKRMTRQVESGLTYEATQTTIAQILDRWMNAKENKLRPATIEQYRRMIRLHIKPHLGNLALKDINAARIQEYYDTRLQDGVGRRTIEIVHAILHGCLEHAKRLELVTQNYAQLVEVPRPEKREMKVWTESQVNQFIAGASDQPFYRLAFATGMRRGEILALQWKDLDWQPGVLRIQRQAFEPEGGGFHFQEPKTERGRRPVHLGQGLIDTLRAQFNQVLPLSRAIAGDHWKEHDLIFPSTVGTPRNGYNVSKEFKRIATTLQLPPIRFHDIRHTAASIMLMNGEPPIRVAAILGQSLQVLLTTYAHYIPGDDQARAAALMDQVTTPIVVDLS